MAYLGTYTDPTFVVPHDPELAKKMLGWPSDGAGTSGAASTRCGDCLMIYQNHGDREILGAAEKANGPADHDDAQALASSSATPAPPAMAGMPSCSVLKPLVMLYRETGNPLFLDYAKEIVSYWDRPGNPKPNFFPNAATGKSLADWYDTDLGRWGKAYEMMSCLDGVLEYYRLTGEARCLEMVKQMQVILWTHERNMVKNVSYNEQFVGACRHLNGTSEPCDAIHWIRLNLDLYLITGDRKYVDVIEAPISTPSSPVSSATAKWAPARFVPMVATSPVARAACAGKHCCVNNMPRTFMDIASMGATREADGTLRVNLYSPFTSDFGDASVMLTGEFPVEDKVTARIEMKKPGRVKFRLPAWSKTVQVRQLPDTEFKTVPAGDWYALDVPAGISAVTLKFDMAVRLEDSDRAASNEKDDYRFAAGSRVRMPPRSTHERRRRVSSVVRFFSRRARSWVDTARTFSPPTSTRAAESQACVRSQVTA